MTDYGHELSFGVFLTPTSADPARVVRLAEQADRSGLELVAFQDHPYLSRFLDCWTLLSYVAARTKRIRLAPCVLNLPLRPPAVLARSAASLDLLSGGRVELGLGAGADAFAAAIRAMGGPGRTPGEAVDALTEAIRILRALWDDSAPEDVRLDGRCYRVEDAERGPAPAHPIGIWLGAYRPRMLRLTGRVADGWLPSSSYLPPDRLAAANAMIDRSARSAGRDPAAVRRLYNLSGDLTRVSRGWLHGPAEQWIDELTGLSLEHGVSGFLVGTDDPELIDRLATDIAPAVRAAVRTERDRAAISVVRRGRGHP